ncbi:hypothetical protein MCUN1_000177 [Malassezia cuniculi]|uniref:Micro-fibrillar-associated protein 1 C-terminal domain-containing protein n=1 Tax=Malassezia cuniculi TaxID=948313 RepID=A0AAF0EQH7_9BASI|nr:hypothetical protein MCUN1_000177 [Malassezia cuniculi]
MSARVPRPAARYRPGKAPKHAQPESDSDEEYAAEVQQQQQQQQQQTETPSLPSHSGTVVSTAGITIQQGSGAIHMPVQNIDLNEYETDSEEEEPHETTQASRHEVSTGSSNAPAPTMPPKMAPAAMAPAAMAPAGSAPRTTQPARPPASMTLAPAEAEETEEEESSEYESSSEEEAAPAPLLKPIFVPRSQRTTQGREEAERARAAEAAAAKAAAEERKKASHDMVAERVRQEIRESQKEQEQIDIDDTDGLDPDAEFEAWRLRELARIKRVQDAEAALVAEREEIERRRALPEEQRIKEDMAHAAATRAQKTRGQQGFMQKYYHKGAFFQDMDILQRDFTEQSVDAVDKTALPRIMQVRDFGKRSRSKWTHLSAEDTSKDDLRARGARERQR